MRSVFLTRLHVITVNVVKLNENIGPIRNISNCYWFRQVSIPLFYTKNSASTTVQHYNCGQSVVKLVDRCHVSSLCLYTRNFNCFIGKKHLSTLVNTKAATMTSESKPFERLPKCVVPKHYGLTIVPNLKTFAFDGDVNIDVQVVQPTNKIILNSLDINFQSVAVSKENEVTSLPAAETNVSTENETAEFVFPNELPIGNYKLKMKFTGEINDKMKGLYRSKYLSQSGEERHVVVTQFEPTDARRCFPCWDEPAIKASFDINLIVPQNLVTLSNMPVKVSNPVDDQLVRVEFERTPVMSTYLVAIVVGEYDYVEDRSTDGVLVRVYTPKGKKEQGLFALEVATKVLPYYKDYFNIAYPLPKIDLIAIADFSAGAMENWGLVTYRETCLLVDPENTSAARKQWIALVVGHELAHQWFGNLVTMEWWTHLWLNEGYASFVEFLCVNHLFPEYDIWTQFVTDMYIRALELDCLKNSHPIEVPVGHPSEIDEIFDDISYDKGASVIRMLHQYIGDDDFRKGMNLYLTRHQYKNTFTEDLWAALEEVSKKPVGTVMNTWTKKMGFPVVTVTSQPLGDGNGVSLTLMQNKFCADGSQPEEENLWMIPISVSTSRDPKSITKSFIFDTKQTTITIPGVNPTDWIKINPGTVGFYRTKYPSGMLANLVPAIQDKSLPPLDRLGLLDDLFALVQAGHTSTVEVLKLMQAFQNEDNYTVWSSIGNCLGKLRVLLSHTDFDEAFKVYERNLLSTIFKRLGWDPLPGERHLDTLLRGLILGRFVWLDDAEIVAEAQKRFAQHTSGGPCISADLRNAVYRAVLRAGDKDTFEQMLKLYRSEDLHEEKNRISQAFGAIRDEEILKKVLDFAMSEEVRSQDTVFVILSVASTKVGRKLAWEFFKIKWQELMNRYQGGFLIARFIKCTTENFADEQTAQEIEEFFKHHKSPGTERTVQQSLESIRRNAAWLQRDAEAIKAYLNSIK